jgi:5-methylcytosine-specific restriction endonuclease McrA
MTVLVLNASYEPLHIVSVRHAIRMLVRQVAVVEEAVEGNRFGQFPMPRVLRLLRYVAMTWRYSPSVPYSRSGVLARDRQRCAYCGRRASTIDHVTPRSRGGATSWTNTVACCFSCNQHKGSRTPDEASMPLLVVPCQPTRGQLHALRG